MKVIFDCELHLLGDEDGEDLDRKLEVIGAPDEDLEEGYVMLVTPEASICVLASDLRRALKVFE